MLYRLSLLAGLATIPAPLLAQSYVPAGSVDMGTYYATLSGPISEGSEPSTGFDAAVRFRTPSLSLGLGYLWIDHSFGSPSTKYIEGPFFEPRYSFPMGVGILSTFVMGRVGRMNLTFEQDDNFNVPTDYETNGWTYGGGAGVSAQLLFFAVDLSAFYSTLSFENYKARGQTIPGSARKGSSFAIRLGMAFVAGPGVMGGK